jgi:hypothetical protein
VLIISVITVINLLGVSTSKSIICFIAMQTYKKLKGVCVHTKPPSAPFLSRSA